MAAAGKAAAPTVAKSVVEGAGVRGSETPAREAPVFTRRRGVPMPAEVEDAYREDVFRELSKMSVQRQEEAGKSYLPVGPPQNTAVIRFQEERKMEEYRRRHKTDRIPGRISEDLLEESLRMHRYRSSDHVSHCALIGFRDAPLEFNAERVAQDWDGVDEDTVRNVLRFVTHPRVVTDGDSKVAT